ncbi:MAG: class II fructose-bisphosphate aldolase [Clostridiales bacterium]|nr:class II fructose-bisphosphate aldolase [Clostridiales bacterium]
MIITEFKKVKEIFDESAKKGWVIPCLCSENQTTTEAILEACSEYGKKIGQRVPIIIAITTLYSHRTQAVNYTYSKDWKTGLKLFKDDIKALAGEGGKYSDVDVLIHLDHVQFDDDIELINSDLSDYSSIMYDASNLPFEQNIEMTKKFVEKMKGKIFIEGACDEIVDATGSVRNALTTPENAKRYIEETGVDMIVANLGTEHRATGKELKYHGDLAREIKKVIGNTIVLHGTSSVNNDQVTELFNDGVCKVNIWTALERDSSKVLFYDMVKNASKVGGPEMVDKLIEEGYLTEKCRTGDKINLAYFTTLYRQQIIFNQIKDMVTEYLNMWYIVK